MKILFFGDSITDAGRYRENPDLIYGLGCGFVRVIADRLEGVNPEEYKIINRGDSGDRIVTLYARIKADAWNLKPDVMTVLIGINDILYDIKYNNGVEIERYEKFYRMLIEDTKKALPNVKLVLCEPFMLKGAATEDTEEIPDRFNRFSIVYEYAKVVKKLAKEYGLHFLALQDKFSEMAAKSKPENYLYDGIHPSTAGATLIANEWMKIFNEEING